MSAQKLLTSRLLWQFGEAEGNEPMIDWQRYRNGNLRDPWNLERLARHRAAKLGYRVHRSRRRKGRDNAGNFMLLHKASSTVLLGSGFTPQHWRWFSNSWNGRRRRWRVATPTDRENELLQVVQINGIALERRRQGGECVGHGAL